MPGPWRFETAPSGTLPPMRRLRVMTMVGLAALGGGCALVAGCGGDDGDDDGDRTTTILPAPSPPAQTEPSGGPTTADPLPGGRAAVDGTYLMRIRRTDYEGQNIVSGMPDGDESNWPITTVCEQDECRLEVRRELESGAYENFTLDEIKDRSYAASSTGKTDCIVGESDKVGTKQRLSIRVSAVAEIDGRPTAQRLDAYMTISATCGNDPVRGIISWRGTRKP